jgi:peptide deformylase
MGGKDSRSHDDDAVATVDDPPLAVGETAVVEHLQEQGNKLARSLLDLVDEDDGVRLATNVLCQLASC